MNYLDSFDEAAKAKHVENLLSFKKKLQAADGVCNLIYDNVL